MTDPTAARSKEARGTAELPIENREARSAWARQARRRYEEIRAGRGRAIDNDEAFARLRARFG